VSSDFRGISSGPGYVWVERRLSFAKAETLLGNYMASAFITAGMASAAH
jgi:hypothetical protein